MSGNKRVNQESSLPAPEAGGVPVHLTDREKKLYDALVAKPGREITVEQAADIFYGGRQRPRTWLRSTMVSLRRVEIKTSASRYPVKSIRDKRPTRYAAIER